MDRPFQLKLKEYLIFLFPYYILSLGNEKPTWGGCRYFLILTKVMLTLTRVREMRERRGMLTGILRDPRGLIHG